MKNVPEVSESTRNPHMGSARDLHKVECTSVHARITRYVLRCRETPQIPESEAVWVEAAPVTDDPTRVPARPCGGALRPISIT